jgi:transcriptional regulator with XRE-family HTH domain
MPMDVSARIATELRVELARRNLRAPALAEILDLSTASVSRKLSGLTPFTVVELDRIATAWGVPICQLLGAHELTAHGT